MINITRRIGTPIKISDEMKITPVQVHGDQVRFEVEFLKKEPKGQNEKVEGCLGRRVE